jgi:hypothetical protein
MLLFVLKDEFFERSPNIFANPKLERIRVKLLSLVFCFMGRPLLNRNHFPFLLNFLGLTGEGAEIGVQTGSFSEIILRESKVRLLYSIDPWKEFKEASYKDVANLSQNEQDLVYDAAVKRLAVYKDRSSILRKTSLEAVREFQDGQLDFAYIDAQHSYEACKEDILAWWPKVKVGGVLAGHDYLDGEIPEGIFGVKQAVNEFAAKNKLKLFVIQEKWPSWYIIKKS